MPKSRYYYRLWFDDNDPQATTSVEWDLKNVDPYFAFSPERLTEWPKDLPLFVTEGDHAEDYLEGSANGWHLFSRDVLRVFTELGVDGVDFHPVRVIRRDTCEELHGYHAMHIWKVRHALDFDNAGWEYVGSEGRKVVSIHRYALLLDNIRGVDIFRLGENTVTEFVSDRITSAITKAKLSGFKFMPVKVR